MLERIALLVLFLGTSGAARAGENLIANGDFEQELTGWSSLWTRSGTGDVTLDTTLPHGGKRSARVCYSGSQDWCFQRETQLDARPGQIYELIGWARLKGEGDATLCVTLRNGQGEVTDWVFAARSLRATSDWQLLKSRFVVPPAAASMQPRLIGNRSAEVWLDDVALLPVGTLQNLPAADLPEKLQTSNRLLDVTLHVRDAVLSIVDRRTGKSWRQQPAYGTAVLDARATEDGFKLRVLQPASMLEFSVAFHLDPQRPELSVELAASGELARPLSFPRPFVTGKGSFLVMPVNEGISYPVDDESLPAMRYHLYGGHGLCMGWYGVTDGEQALMTIVETPDDAAVRVPRRKGLLCLAPEWVAQRGKFGPSRRLRYVFFDRGGYVAMCKRYREHSKQTGLFRTLAEKRKDNANVDLLVGAVNTWCWEKDPVTVCREMQSAGIGRILWSHRANPDTLKRLNELGVLTSRYDIYQDVMNPENFPKLHGVHSDWTTGAWPDDLLIGPDGRWRPGWRVRGKDGEWYPCGVLCDRRAVEYARGRIPAELKTHPYRCRFIDTTTASPWRECYDEDHPMTRSESRHWKMELLRIVSRECRLVAGSETGHEAAVPYVHYFEGMLSLGPYRVPDAGRKMIEPWHEVPERVAKFQTGHYYRLPLWELVYHDCVVAHWYWGDYNNKLPQLWDRRDLFNVLYGTPPMFMFNRKIWQQNRDRFVRSYQTVTPVARATGYAEMLSHRWLTADHAVQETRFANGVTVTVNFGDQPHAMTDGTLLDEKGVRTLFGIMGNIP